MALFLFLLFVFGSVPIGPHARVPGKVKECLYLLYFERARYQSISLTAVLSQGEKTICYGTHLTNSIFR